MTPVPPSCPHHSRGPRWCCWSDLRCFPVLPRLRAAIPRRLFRIRSGRSTAVRGLRRWCRGIRCAHAASASPLQGSDQGRLRAGWRRCRRPPGSTCWCRRNRCKSHQPSGEAVQERSQVRRRAERRICANQERSHPVSVRPIRHRRRRRAAARDSSNRRRCHRCDRPCSARGEPPLRCSRRRTPVTGLDWCRRCPWRTLARCQRRRRRSRRGPGRCCRCHHDQRLPARWRCRRTSTSRQCRCWSRCCPSWCHGC